jgi:hypothetical protein
MPEPCLVLANTFLFLARVQRESRSVPLSGGKAYALFWFDYFPNAKADMNMQPSLKPPPFTRETALLKGKAAEDARNSGDPERVALAYTSDSEWRNRTEFFTGREAIKAFLRHKWPKNETIT